MGKQGGQGGENESRQLATRVRNFIEGAALPLALALL